MAISEIDFPTHKLKEAHKQSSITAREKTRRPLFTEKVRFQLPQQLATENPLRRLTDGASTLSDNY